jgi:phage terminase large subunit-like protein
MVIQSWDTALESTKANAYSACCTFGIFSDKNGLKNIILLSMWRGNVEYPDLRRLAIRMFHDYRDDDLHKPIRPSGRHKVDVLLVEAKASGISLIQDLMRAGLSPTRFDPTKFGDKIQRVRTVSHIIENGRVWLPAMPPEFDRLRKFADICLYEYSVFPNGSSRDLVDCLTQVLIRLNLGGWIKHSQDPEEEYSETNYREEPLY